MKNKIGLYIVFLLIILVKGNAQTINVTDILTCSDQYIDMIYQSDNIKILTQEAKRGVLSRGYKILKNENENVEVTNLLAALNFMYTLGYEVVMNYNGETGFSNRYLLKKVPGNKKELLPSKL